MSGLPALIFEPKADGHRPFYVRTLLEEALRSAERVHFALHPELLEGLGPALRERAAAQGIALLPISAAEAERCDAPSMLTRRLAQAATAQAYRERAGAGMICFLFIDDVIPLLALGLGPLRGTPVTGILFRPTLHYAALGCAEHGRHRRPGAAKRLDEALRGLLIRRALQRASLPVLLTLDRLLPGHAAQHLPGGGKLRFLPEPFAPIEGLSAIPPASGRRTLLLFGHLSARKGILELLDAFAGLGEAHLARARLHLAGRLDGGIAEAVRARVAALAGRAGAEVKLDDRFVSDAELARMLAGASVVLAPYRDHVGSSGVLVWAALARRPVLTQAYGLLGQLTRHYRLGLACDTSEPAALRGALERCIDEPLASLADAGGMAEFAGQSAPGLFASTLFEALRLRVPAASSPPA